MPLVFCSFDLGDGGCSARQRLSGSAKNWGGGGSRLSSDDRVWGLREVQWAAGVF